MEFEKLRIFSKKLNGNVDLQLCPAGITTNGVLLAWTDSGWANSGGNWINSGWANSGGSWINSGWANSGGSWTNSGWANSGGSWTNSGWSNSGGGCFITTACVEHLGMPDDCEALTVLREFRDSYVERDSDFREKVLDYYKKGPAIVGKIMEQPDKGRILEELYSQMIQPCVTMIKDCAPEKAIKHYYEYYEYLIKQYLPA